MLNRRRGVRAFNCDIGIAARAIVQPGVRAPAPEARIPFRLEGSASVAGGRVDGLVLLTDQADAELIYTARVIPPALFPQLFVDALAWRLAARFALGIQKKPAVAAQMEQRYEMALSVAIASQNRQSREDRPPDSEFVSVRG